MDAVLAAAVPHLRDLAANSVSANLSGSAGLGRERMEEAPPLPLGELGTEVKDWVALLKPRVMTLVVFTGLIGLLMAPGHLNPVLGFTAVLCIAVAAGACGVVNMWYDRDIDALMRRTRKRPLPAGRIPPNAALGFGIVLAVGAVLVMFLATNAVAATILTLSISFYVFIYTMWLKRRTPQNIVIGGAAGAFPPVIGWAAVTGSLDLAPLVLFAIIFFWTPPHFWSLALWVNDDYRRANVPMLPVTAGARATRRQILLYTALLVLVSLAPWALGFSGWLYLVTAVVLGVGFLVHAGRILHDRQDGQGVSLSGDLPAKAGFKFSILYLFTLFAALAVDHYLG